jgi:hypothetical protein
MKVPPFLKSDTPHLRKSPKPYLAYILGFQTLFFGVTPGFFNIEFMSFLSYPVSKVP